MNPANKRRGPGRPKGSGAGREYTERVNVPCTVEQKARYQAAADDLETGLSKWMRDAADAAEMAQQTRTPGVPVSVADRKPAGKRERASTRNARGLAK